MKIFTIAAIIYFSSSLMNAQTNIDSIKSNYRSINGYHGIGDYKQDEDQEKEIGSILTLDVFGYYSLSQYDSELKKDIFSKTAEYKTNHDELKSIKSELLDSYYYLDLDANLTTYNLSTKTFTFGVECMSDDFYNSNYIQFDRICFVKPKGFTIIDEKYMNSDNSGYYIYQNISFKITNNDIALKIEESNNDFRLLFVFKFLSSKRYQWKASSQQLTWTFNGLWYLTKLYRVIAYNKRTGEIFREYEVNK